MTLRYKNPDDYAHAHYAEQFSQPMLGKISSTLDGTIIVALKDDALTHKVDRTAVGLPILRSGDEIVAQRIDGLLVLTHRLQRSDEGQWPIQVDDMGNITITAGQTISLRTIKGTITIDSLGNIRLKGHDLMSEATSTNSIIGKKVAIN